MAILRIRDIKLLFFNHQISTFCDKYKPTAQRTNKSYHFGEQMPLTSSCPAFLRTNRQHRLHPSIRVCALHRHEDIESFDLPYTLTLFVEMRKIWNVPHMWEDAFFHKNAPVWEEREWERLMGDGVMVVKLCEECREKVWKDKKENERERKKERALLPSVQLEGGQSPVPKARVRLTALLCNIAHLCPDKKKGSME